jgi:hypothetical protein
MLADLKFALIVVTPYIVAYVAGLYVFALIVLGKL